MDTPMHPLLRRTVQALQLAAAAAGALASYQFGLRIGGLPLAVLLAANGAFFGAIMVDFVADRVRILCGSGGHARRGSSD